MVFEKKTSPLITTAASTTNNNNGHDDNRRNKIKKQQHFPPDGNLLDKKWSPLKVPVTLIFFYFRRKVEAFTDHNILKLLDFLQSCMFFLRRKMYDICAFEMPLRF